MAAMPHARRGDEVFDAPVQNNVAAGILATGKIPRGRVRNDS